VKDTSLPCWRHRLRALDPCGVMGSQRLVDGFVVEGRRYRGGGPRRWLGVEATGQLGNAALRLMCGFGVEWCKLGLQPRSWRRVFVTFDGCVVRTMELRAYVVFRLGLSYT
jgi:hypothetical protein